jgi:hypothetical protein
VPLVSYTPGKRLRRNDGFWIYHNKEVYTVTKEEARKEMDG